MRGSRRTGLIGSVRVVVQGLVVQRLALTLAVGATLGGCGDAGLAPRAEDPVPGRSDAVKTAALVRAERRAYDGAPPVIPHAAFESTCVSCHNQEGVAVPGVGFSPPSPHVATAGLSAISRCEQCHVRAQSHAPWVASAFAGLRQDLRKGRRLHAEAPPVIPHPTLMRENCVACHTGPAAREAIRTSHPERANCRQCHVAQTTTATFGATP